MSVLVRFVFDNQPLLIGAALTFIGSGCRQSFLLAGAPARPDKGAPSPAFGVDHRLHRGVVVEAVAREHTYLLGHNICVDVR